MTSPTSATPAFMGIVTFHHPKADYPKLHQAMLREGYALATSTVLKGRTVLRFCTINPRTNEEDVERMIEWMDAIAKSCS